MIKTVKVTNHLGESVVLELGRPEKSGFLVRGGGIDGLGPSRATINTTEAVTIDGASYNSGHVSSRNVVFSLGFLEMPTIEDTRQKSYKYFPIKRRIGIEVETDNRVCSTYGYVESNEPNIFSNEEGTTISVICPDAYFYSPAKSVSLFSSIVSLFEFPFSSEMEYEDSGNGRFMGVLSLTKSIAPFTAPEELIELSYIEIDTETTIVYSGDAPVGIIIYIHALGSVDNLTISNFSTLESMTIDNDRLVALTGYGIKEGDDIIISTVKGNKFVILNRDAVLTNIRNTIEKNPDWFQLEKGDNTFGYTADSGVENLQFRIENQIAYEGI